MHASQTGCTSLKDLKTYQSGRVSWKHTDELHYGKSSILDLDPYSRIKGQVILASATLIWPFFFILLLQVLQLYEIVMPF